MTNDTDPVKMRDEGFLEALLQVFAAKVMQSFVRRVRQDEPLQDNVVGYFYDAILENLPQELMGKLDLDEMRADLKAGIARSLDEVGEETARAMAKELAQSMQAAKVGGHVP